LQAVTYFLIINFQQTNEASHKNKAQKICKKPTLQHLNQGWAIACYLGAWQICSEEIIRPENIMTLHFV
jgi:hypothetical protein